MPWEWPVGATFAFALALIATPAGVSGAVLLLPVQLSVLSVPSPAVTPTNLLFNVAATPGALLRFSAGAPARGPAHRLADGGDASRRHRRGGDPCRVLIRVARVLRCCGGRAP